MMPRNNRHLLKVRQDTVMSKMVLLNNCLVRTNAFSTSFLDEYVIPFFTSRNNKYMNHIL